MADGTTLNSMSGGDKIQTEDLGAAGKIERVKLAVGGKDSDSGDAQTGAGNSDAATLRVVVASNQVVIPVSASSLPLPTSASTAAKQPSIGTAGTPSADVISVQGIAGGYAQPVISQVGQWNPDMASVVSGQYGPIAPPKYFSAGGYSNLASSGHCAILRKSDGANYSAEIMRVRVVLTQSNNPPEIVNVSLLHNSTHDTGGTVGVTPTSTGFSLPSDTSPQYSLALFTTEPSSHGTGTAFGFIQGSSVRNDASDASMPTTQIIEWDFTTLARYPVLQGTEELVVALACGGITNYYTVEVFWREIRTA